MSEGDSIVKDGDLAEGVGRCRLCGGEVAPALTAHERMFGLGDAFRYVECRECGGLQIETIPEDLERYYGAEYYTRRPDSKLTRVRRANAIRRAASRFRLGQGAIRRVLSGRRYARFDWFRRTATGLDDPILDVGCGSGRLLRRMARSGFSHLMGIDPSWTGPTCPAEGLRFERDSPENHQGSYRLVMAHHSFEHMRDPGMSFAAMSRLVEPAGHLLIRVPRADSWARRHYGADWVQLDAPRHLHLPTRRSFEHLARANGLRIVHVGDDSGPFQIWGSERYRRGESLVQAGRSGNRRPSIGALARARWRARRLSADGLGDQACFYFRREA